MNDADDDLNVLDFARRSGLCRDYTTDPPALHSLIMPLNDTLIRDLRDPSDEITTNDIDEITRQKLTVSKEAAFLLKEVLTVPSARSSDEFNSVETSRRTRMRNLKQELPVLSTDSELDLLSFGNGDIPDFRSLRIPSEITNLENDESFEWPARYFDYPMQCDASVRSEKLTISRDALLYMQASLRDDYTNDHLNKITSETCGKCLTQTRHITPPLLPLSPPMSPHIPSSPTCRLPLPSDGDDSVKQETKTLEHEIMAADALQRRISESSDSMLLDTGELSRVCLTTGTQVTPIKKRGEEDLKVEGPLTPSMFSTSPMKKLKSVSFAETLPDYIPAVAWWRDGSGSDDDTCSVDIHAYDHFFDDIAPLVAQSKVKLEKEQLSGADTTARVDVPDVDLSLPVAPWLEYTQRTCGELPHGGTELDLHAGFLRRIKREDLQTLSSWHGLSALERKLHWSIVTTKVTTVSLTENLHGEGDMTKILSEGNLDDIVTSASLIWKPEGLRILSQQDEEDEVESDESEYQSGVEAVVRKRKLDLVDNSTEFLRKRTSPYPNIAAQKTESRAVVELQRSKDCMKGGENAIPTHAERATPNSAVRKEEVTSRAVGNNNLMFDGFSAVTALHKFMETRGKPWVPASTRTTFDMISPQQQSFRPQERPSEQPPTGNSQIQVPASPPFIPKQSEYRHSAQAMQELPALPSNLAPCSIIISSKFLQQRHFMKAVEQLHPSLEVVYRDYSLLHSCAEEADIIVSPCTGLVFSTLQQVKQRALPGQPDASPLAQRLAGLSSRYERLMVVISEGLSREMEEQGSSRPEDVRDKEALQRLENVASKLEGDVSVKLVRGGETALAHATVFEIAQYSLPHGSVDLGDVKPCAEETTWEVFLRRIGLNPFAAQVVAAKLSPPFEMHIPVIPDGSSPLQQAPTIPVSGLAAFLMMDGGRRVQSFQTILGGSRVLQRMGSILDQQWMSAAHGFRL
ncbi:hypothetical protein ACN47E_009360 [Coniothyrium glycines]